MKAISLQPNLIHAGNLILVNAKYPYHENIVHQTLSPVSAQTSEILLDDHVVKLLSDIMNQMNGWNQIVPVSGWRSMKEQIEIYEGSLRENGRAFTEKYVALPNHSEHQTGLAIDLALKQESIDFIRPDFPYTGICQAFRQKSVSYGFIERYPLDKEAITGIAQEPWHFRYVGVPHAEIMAKHDFVLEEYISFLRAYPYEIQPYIHESAGMRIAISYLEANKTSNTILEIDDKTPYSISGNNIDGFIITQWRKPYERK